MKLLITICARGGSKGIPGKNIKLLNGKPLIGYTIEIAQRFAALYPDSVIALSTDSEEIKAVAKELGLDSDYTRPSSLAGDRVGKIAAIADIVYHTEAKEGAFDYVLDLDVTSPLRNIADLEAAFAQIQADHEALNLFSVSPASRNPYFNMVEEQASGYYEKVKSVGDVLSRQKAPAVYDINGSFYFYRRSFFEGGYAGPITERSLVYVMPHTCFDLDHPIDYEFMAYLIEHNKLDFELN